MFFDLKLSPTSGDNDSANELQTISKSGITTTLSNGGGSVNEVVTSVSQSTNSGVITYINESTIAQIANVISSDADNNISVGSDGGTYKAFRVIDTGGQNIITVPVKMILKQERTNIGGFTLDFNGNIRIPENGIYEINYSVAYENISGGFNFCDEASELRLNGLTIIGSQIFTSHTTTPTSSQTGSRGIILKLNSDDILNIWCKLANGTGTILNIASGSGLTIKKLD